MSLRDWSELGVIWRVQDFFSWSLAGGLPQLVKSCGQLESSPRAARLDDSEIDLSCKFDLFDVLDADLSGELEFEASRRLGCLYQIGIVTFLSINWSTI